MDKAAIKERVVAIARLIVALTFVWCSIANAANIDVLDFVEGIRYAISHPESLMAAFMVGIAWWYNENISDRAIRDAERNKVLDNEPNDFYEDEEESDTND